MRRASSAAAAILTACALAATSVLPAAAASNSKVTIGIGFHTQQGNPFFKGRVKSGRKSCTRNRLVRVYRVVNQRRTLFGSDRSDAQGFWRLQMRDRMKTGGYVAVAKAKAGCLKGFSSPIAVGQRGPDGLGPGGSGK
jgi:hypothetical protein